jgi:hypothetical protein
MKPEQREELLSEVSLETRLAGLTEEQILQYLKQRKANRKTATGKPRRKKK